MGWFDWLKTWFASGKPTRDVSTLADADATREVVPVGDQPLKPPHLRRALRDPRLLPKSRPKTDPYVWPRARKPKLIPAAEARRLFSETMRTRDRQIRDLATDEVQLLRYELPVWKSEADVAAALEISERQLRHFSIHRQRETSPHYVAFAVPKRAGGTRTIHAPKRRLKAIQRKLNHLLVRRLPVSSVAHGFCNGRSVATNARPHTGKRIVLKMDLQDCFPSIHFGRVRGLLIALGYGYPVATCLAVLMTEAERQRVEADGTIYHVPVGPRYCVQGAPTSPGLCNAVLMRLDRRVAGLASKYGYHYTRYADDLTLSGNDASRVQTLISVVKRIVRDEGFGLNARKTRVLRRGQRQQVTGVVVNQQLGLSRQERRCLRARIHQWNREDQTERKRIEGKLAYLKMLNPAQAAPLHAAFRAACQQGD
jgi:retron-type reverse transcriptase